MYKTQNKDQVRVLLRWYDSFSKRDKCSAVDIDRNKYQDENQLYIAAINEFKKDEPSATNIRASIMQISDEEKIYNASITLEAVNREMKKSDFNNFFIGGYEVLSDGLEMQFDWDDMYASVINATEDHNLRIEADLSGYNYECYPGHLFTSLKEATELTEVYQEILYYDENTNEETNYGPFKIVDFTIQNEAGEEFSFSQDILNRYNSSQII